jgi:hypothetical protein
VLKRLLPWWWLSLACSTILLRRESCSFDVFLSHKMKNEILEKARNCLFLSADKVNDETDEDDSRAYLLLLMVVRD